MIGQKLILIFKIFVLTLSQELLKQSFGCVKLCFLSTTFKGFEWKWNSTGVQVGLKSKFCLYLQRLIQMRLIWLVGWLVGFMAYLNNWSQFFSFSVNYVTNNKQKGHTVTVSITGSEHEELSSNSGRGCLRFSSHKCLWERHKSILTSSTNG